MAPADFAGKFELLMKLLSVSRARVAADLGIDKSVVNRWARGDTLPTPQNLGALTALVARRRAGFTRLDWDRDLANLAAMFGATLPSPGPRVAEGPGAPMDVLRASRALSRIEVERDGGAYPGVYVAYRQSFRNSGRIIPDLIVLSRKRDRLFFAVHDLGFSYRGEALILRHQLFLFGEDAQRVDGLTLHVLNGVVGRKAVRMDGLLLGVYGDRFRTPAGSPVVLHRLMDLDESARPPAAATLTAILSRLLAIYESDGIVALAGPATAAAVRPVVGAASPSGATDHLLRAPTERSLSAAGNDWDGTLEADTRRLRRALLGLDDCFEVFDPRPGPGPQEG